MRILVLSEYIEDYKDRASFNIRYKTAQKMSEKGHHVIFMSPSRKSFNTQGKYLTNNFKVIETIGFLPVRLRSGGFSILDALYKIIFVIFYKFDIIHVTNGHRPAHILPCMVGKYLRHCVIVDECWEWLGSGGYASHRRKGLSKIISVYDKLFELRLKKVFNHIITISTALKKRFKVSDNVTVIHGGMENKVLRNYEIEWARRFHRIPQAAFVIGMSNITSNDEEDNDIFFKAFERLCDKYNYLYLLCTCSDIKYIEEIKNKYSFGEKLIFSEWLDFDSYNIFMSACNVFVMPYKNTTINIGRWPNKIGDYLCLDRPVITNPTGDIKSLFEKYKLGFLCKESAEDFYRKIEDILDKRNILKNFCSDSLYVANEILSFDARVDYILKLFDSLYKLNGSDTKVR